jgi:hypothetical protein
MQQAFCRHADLPLFVGWGGMASGPEQVVELGRWLAAERTRRTHRGETLSTPTLARMVNMHIDRAGLPVKKIHQQEISNLENASADKGPKRFQPWMQVLRDFIESGKLDELLAAAAGELDTLPKQGFVIDFAEAYARRDVPVKTPDGRVVGHIVWDKQQ